MLIAGVYGFGCEDALMHLLNYAWPNMLENSAHLIQRWVFALEGMRVSLGPLKVSHSAPSIYEYNTLQVLQYVLQSLWHPARKVREPCWKVKANYFLN